MNLCIGDYVRAQPTTSLLILEPNVGLYYKGQVKFNLPLYIKSNRVILVI